MSADLVTWLRNILDEDEAQFSNEFAVFVGWLPYGHAEWVLADIAAKRAILDQHGIDDRNVEDGITPTCRTCREDRLLDQFELEPLAYPCPTVRLLASAYADRPGYDEKWR